MPLLNKDSLNLAYEEAGSGDPPLVLIHGWSCDRSYMSAQLSHFKAAHRVVAVDLRGHGESDKPDDEYSIAVYADDVAWMARKLGLAGAIFVGHSMGGLVALEVTGRYPELASRVVMLDSPVFMRDEIKPLIAQTLEGLRSPGYAEVQQQLVANALFIATDDAALKESTIAGMSSARQDVMMQSFASLAAFDSAAAASACKVPALYVGAEPQLNDISQFKELCPQLMVAKTAGAGHFHQLLVPGQVNLMIDRFLYVTADSAVAVNLATVVEG